MKILANDRISPPGIELLKEAGFEVFTTKVAQEQLINFINENEIGALLVRSGTKVRKDLIDACPELKIIGRAGVGTDNIDVDYAQSKGIKVLNTPEAPAGSVAELVFAHLLGGIRHLYDSNRNMPLEGDSRFKELKKNYSAGTELRGKTLGIIGLGSIGQEVAKIAIALGMNVIAGSNEEKEVTLTLEFFDGRTTDFQIETKPLEELFKKSDFISLHVPAQKEYLIGKNEIEKMKDGVGIINTSRGGIIDEVALVEALDSGKVAFAALDTFENEPTPAIKVLMNPHISLSPHIGGSTREAQDRIGVALAKKVIEALK
ncbi:MAG TPA: D-2-hydroxyacid dehydrogenase [Salinimicrobium sp.]|nr:D-2-hydroxyacid dehydrogenase [Salinimicrobium sp.]